MRELIGPITELARLALQFGRTNRITYHEDGKTLESDTDHTVMLGLVACAVAERVNLIRSPTFDLGLIAQFTIVHDLVEAICGDTNTLVISSDGRQSKELRERAALEQLRTQFSSLPWIVATIDCYERLDTSEARFVKVLDKVLPKLTHLLNNGAALHEHGVDLARLATVNRSQREAIAATYGKDQPEALELLLAVHDELCTVFKEGGVK